MNIPETITHYGFLGDSVDKFDIINFYLDFSDKADGVLSPIDMAVQDAWQRSDSAVHNKFRLFAGGARNVMPIIDILSGIEDIWTPDSTAAEPRLVKRAANALGRYMWDTVSLENVVKDGTFFVDEVTADLRKTLISGFDRARLADIIATFA